MPEENKPKTILVADDEVETLEHLVHTLKRINCKVISTTRGRDVVRMAKAEKPDLIILDVVMPDMDGGQIAGILADTPQTANIPVIFLTGILTKEECFGRTTSGKRFVIPKPVDSAELLKKISMVLPST